MSRFVCLLALLVAQPASALFLVKKAKSCTADDLKNRAALQNKIAGVCVDMCKEVGAFPKCTCPDFVAPDSTPGVMTWPELLEHMDNLSEWGHGELKAWTSQASSALQRSQQAAAVSDEACLLQDAKVRRQVQNKLAGICVDMCKEVSAYPKCTCPDFAPPDSTPGVMTWPELLEHMDNLSEWGHGELKAWSKQASLIQMRKDVGDSMEYLEDLDEDDARTVRGETVNEDEQNQSEIDADAEGDEAENAADEDSDSEEDDSDSEEDSDTALMQTATKDDDDDDAEASTDDTEAGSEQDDADQDAEDKEMEEAAEDSEAALIQTASKDDDDDENEDEEASEAKTDAESSSPDDEDSDAALVQTTKKDDDDDDAETSTDESEAGSEQEDADQDAEDKEMEDAAEDSEAALIQTASKDDDDDEAEASEQEEKAEDFDESDEEGHSEADEEDGSEAGADVAEDESDAASESQESEGDADEEEA